MTQAPNVADASLERFAHPTYTVRRKVFKLFGGAFHVYGPDGELALYSKMKAFKLREDIRLYSDESMSQELLTIHTKSVFDISGTYDVEDSVSGERIGALQRRGFKSMLRDEWLILDAAGQQVGKITEDSTLKALVRRFVDAAALLLPQTYHVEMDGQAVATMRQSFNFIVQRLHVDFSTDTEARLDRRLGLAAAVLLLAVEGRQDS